ncbi:MAG: hypothetical protein U0840_09365 [Gemmataceae bacterium]
MSPPGGDGLIITPVEAGTPEIAANPTALEIDEWGLRRGRELLTESARRAAQTQ